MLKKSRRNKRWATLNLDDDPATHSDFVRRVTQQLK
jgi:hypothetical protein